MAQLDEAVVPPRLLTHDDAGDFEAVYHSFVLGDRPDWWLASGVIYTFEPTESGPDGPCVALGLEDAVEWLYALHYDLRLRTVLPGWGPDPTRPKDSGVPHHRLSITKQWRNWRQEREELNRPIQTRAIRQQLFAHAPRLHQPGVTFSFSELPAIVRTRDPYEAARAAGETVRADERRMTASWEAFRSATVEGVVASLASEVELAMLLMGEHSPLRVPRAQALRAVRGSEVEGAVRNAYELADGRVRSWTPNALQEKFWPQPRWSALTEAQRRDMLSGEDASLRRATALYYDYHDFKSVHDEHRSQLEQLIARLAEWHAERFEDDLTTALAAFDPSSEYYLGVKAADAKEAANRTPGSPLSLLDLFRRTGL